LGAVEGGGYKGKSITIQVRQRGREKGHKGRRVESNVKVWGLREGEGAQKRVGRRVRV
jgi:hypothetical protein